MKTRLHTSPIVVKIPWHQLVRIGLMSRFVVISPNAHNVICRVLLEPTVKRLKHAQKKNVFRNDSPEGATDTSAKITGKLSILCVE